MYHTNVQQAFHIKNLVSYEHEMMQSLNTLSIKFSPMHELVRTMAADKDEGVYILLIHFYLYGIVPICEKKFRTAMALQ